MVDVFGIVTLQKFCWNEAPISSGGMPMMRTRRAGVGAAAALALAVTTLAGCGSSGGSSSSPNSITVWSLENQPDRVALTQKIAGEFTKQTGIHVKIVGIDEAQF